MWDMTDKRHWPVLVGETDGGTTITAKVTSLLLSASAVAYSSATASLSSKCWEIGGGKRSNAMRPGSDCKAPVSETGYFK